MSKKNRASKEQVQEFLAANTQIRKRLDVAIAKHRAPTFQAVIIKHIRDSNIGLSQALGVLEDD